MTRAVGICAALVLLLAGCGSGTAPPATSGGPQGTLAATAKVVAAGGAGPADACALLTQAQVSAALGVAVEAGQHQGSARSCQWFYEAATSDPSSARWAELTIEDAMTFADQQHAPSGNGITIRQAGGVGDAAFYTEAGVLGTNLTFAKGPAYLSIAVLGNAFSVAQAEAAERTLALQMLARL